MIVLFDLDGTLINAVHDLTESVNVAMERMGRAPHDVETVGSWLGNGMPRLLHRALTLDMHADANASDHATCVAHFREAYATCGHHKTQVLPGATALLQWLREAGWFTAITTNKPQDAAECVQAAMAGAMPVDAVYGGEHLWPRKPDPAMLFAARDAGGGGEAVLVGDSVTDRDAAANAGMRFVGVRGGFNHGCDLQDNMPADGLVFDSLVDVHAWLEQQA